MPIAIETRYIGPTDTLGARIKVTANGRPFSLTVGYGYDGNEHERAARAFRDKFFAGRPLIYCGESRDGRGDIFSIGADEVKA